MFPLLVILGIGCADVPLAAPQVRIEPAEPRTTDDLRAVIASESLDREGDPVTYTTTWLEGGVVRSIDPELHRDATARGQEWVVEVVPAHALAEGPGARASVTIANSPPEVRVTLDPERPRAEDDILCVPDTADADEDEVTTSIQWLVDGEVVGVGDLITSGEHERGDPLQCRVVPHDGTDAGDAALSDLVFVGNTPPEITSLALVPAAPVRGTPLGVEVEAFDFEGDHVTYAYRWTVDGAEVGTGATLPGDAFSRDQVVEVRLTPSDGVEEGAHAWVQARVVNAAPTIEGVELSPDPAYTADVLTAAVVGASDLDGDALSWQVAWTVDGDEVEGETGLVLSGEHHFDRDQEVAVELAPHDGFTSGPAVQASLVVCNSPPSITGASIDATVVLEATTITCAGEGWSDPDGDSEGYDTVWYVNGTAASTSRAADGDDFSRGDSVYCDLAPDDGTDTGSTRTSSPVEVANAPPLPPGIEVTPGDEASTSQDLLCEVVIDSVDYDGDPVSYTWQWYHDGVATSHTGEEVDDEDTTAGTWTCEVTASDPYGGEFDTSESVVVYSVGGDLSADSAAAILLGDGGSEYAGWALATGDLDGDGYGDLVAGAPWDDGGATDAGAVTVTWGPLEGEGYLLTDGVEWIGATADERSGTAVAVGDADGDGQDDLLVAGPTSDAGASDAGVIWLLHGPLTTDGELADADAWMEGASSSLSLGTALALGDLTGDATDDVVASMPGYLNSRGRVLVLETPATGELFASDAEATVTGASEGDDLGRALAAGGDMDGDGTGDLAVAAPGEDGYCSEGGAVHVFLGPLSGSLGPGHADALYLGPTAGDVAGQTVAWAGDTDGDGYEDLLVGTPYEDTGGLSAGAVWLILGSSSPSSTTLLSAADAVITGAGADDRAGHGLTGPGDLDGDGYDEIAVGAFSDNTATLDAGAAYLFLGPVSGSLSADDADLIRRGVAAIDEFGHTLAGGELTGDAYADLAVAAIKADDGSTTEVGATYIIRGGP